MTSRRPMTRSYSGNGRTSSFSEEDGSSSNGRNTYLSNVRPENRSTLCSVMAQLTEDIQPSFETTLKSKAVSENCNVKFTCVVSGYPAPELKWYKDDMEIDRYCGLPKYEIRRNGKTHTLHIYNCTLDDAAIYQASASNSKGIVSCSGVLEVGTMNEYKIHQRFFAKLKQKAEKKKRDLEEHTKKDDKENIRQEKPQKSPEPPPRKRHVPHPQEKPVVKEPESGEQPGATAEPNGVSLQVMQTETSTNITTEKEVLPPVETLAKKKMKISNGGDVAVNNGSGNSTSVGRSHMMGNGGENCYDGGISLAQFLAETLQSQASDEKQNSSRMEKPKEMNAPIVNDRKETEGMQKAKEEQEKIPDEKHDKDRRSDEDLSRESETDRESSSEMLHTTAHGKHCSESKHRSKAHKDHDHHNIQASISSMLHTVKDFLFGKNKKDSNEYIEDSDREFDDETTKSHYPDTPPSFRLQLESNPDVYKPPTEDVVLMETDKPKESSENVDIQQQSASLATHEPKHEDSVVHIELRPAAKFPPESTEESIVQGAKEADDAVEAMEVSVGTDSIGPAKEIPSSGLQVLTEMEDKDSQVVSLIREVPVKQQEPDCLVDSPQPGDHTARDDSSPGEDISVLPQTKSPCEEGEEQMSVSDMGKEGKTETEEGLFLNKLCEKEKTEVKSSPQSCSDINRSEITELTAPSLEERVEPCEAKTPDQALLPEPAVAAETAEKDYAKEEAESTSLVQEMNVVFPPSAAPESLESIDLKIQPECPPSTAGKTAEVHTLDEIPSLGFTSHEEKSESKEVVIVSEENVEVQEERLCNNLNRQQHATVEGDNTETRTEGLQSEMETVKIIEELNESKMILVTQNNVNSDNVMEEHTEIAQPDGGETQPVQPLENIPQIQISTIEDITEVKPTVPHITLNEHFVIPKIEIMEPELKECTQPLTFPALPEPEPEPEPAVLQRHDATVVPEVMVQNQSVTDSPGMLPTEEGMQSDYNLSLAQKVKEVAQLDDEREIFEQEKPCMKSSEQLPQMDYASIPVINVSCTDDKENDAFVNAHVSHTPQPSETPTVPLFVVPPISVTCHESDPGLRLTTCREWAEAETSAATQSGTKHDTEISENAKVEITESRKQNLEEVSDKRVKEKSPSILLEDQLPKAVENESLLNKAAEKNIVPEKNKIKPLKETKIENSVSVEEPQRNRCIVERLSSKPPAHPSLSPASLRKFMPKFAPDQDNEAATTVPTITVGDRQSDKAEEDLSGGSTPTSSLSCESSPRLKRRDSLSLIRSATPEELASGARRKIFIPKAKDDGDGALLSLLDTQGKKESPYMSPSQARRAALLLASTGQKTPPMERRSPLLSRRKATLEVPKVVEETPKEEPVTKKEEKPAEKKLDPLKAPQVIRKIRGEPFPDASGHLKLWCQFFNVLSDSTIKWYRDEEEILEVKRSGGDESQVALAIVLASSQDCGVYGCTIKNEYGTDTTDFLLSVDILSEILLKDDLEVGEEIEMTPMLFSKGLADCGNWGNKYFGRIMTETSNIGEGCAHKASKVKVIYGLDPVFDSGSNCIIKVQSPIAYGTKEERNLTERNLEITKQECKVQNMIREYCKIFAAEARVIENFGHSLEVIPQYLMYRPANSVPYATVEADLAGVFLKYCMMDPKGRLITRTISEVEQKCSAFQHWIHQWTHGNLLITRLEGVEWKLTNVSVVTKSKGYQGLTEIGSPEVFEQFLTQHQCNYYCGLLDLRPLKPMDSLQPSKIKGSRSPLLNRKLGSNSPQLQRKGQSPQLSRKANSSPRVTRKVQEPENSKSDQGQACRDRQCS